MADARAKAVLQALIDNSSRRAHLFDAITDLGTVLGHGDVVDLPIQAAPTNVSATSRAAPQSLTPTVSTMTADQEAFYNIALPKREVEQLLEGNWPASTAVRSEQFMQSQMDQNLIDYLYTAAWDTAGTYHNNVDDGALDDDDIEGAIAAICSQDGAYRDNLLLIVSSYAEGSLRVGAPTWNPGYIGAADQGGFGVEKLDRVAGVPILQSNGVVRNRSVATTAVTVTSNVATATVAAGHNLVAGMYITTSGLTTNVSVAVPITSVTATTIVYPLTAANGALADGVGTIEARTSMNLLIDRMNVFGARQIMPKIRVVPDVESAGDALQLYRCYARAAIPGRVRVLHSRGSAV